MARLTAVPRPLVTDAGAAGEADAAVDDQDAAVIAMVEALERERVDRVVAGEVTAVSAQQLAKRLGHLVGADRVHQDVDADAGPAALGQRLGHLARDLAVFVDEVGEGDGRAGGVDRGQHRRKDLLAVEQHLGAVTPDEARHRVGLHGPDEGGLADLDVGGGVLRPAECATRQRDAQRGHGEPGWPRHTHGWCSPRARG